MSPFKLFFGGAEEPGWRRLLADNGARHITLSYRHLHRRLPTTKPWLLEEKVEPGIEVFLDSAAFNAKKDEREHALDLWHHYQAFVEENIERLTLFSEFDARPDDIDWIEQQRAEVWSRFPREKFMPVWHSQYGIPKLREMAQEYITIGIPRASISPPVMAAVRSLRDLADFHAVGEADPDVLRAGFASASTHSWLSATKYGETIVWAGNRLKRYPAKMKDTARRRHRVLIENAGFDAEAIAGDDHDELARFTVWSFLRLEESLGSHRPGAVTGQPVTATEGILETVGASVAGLPTPVRKSRVPMPVLYTNGNGAPGLHPAPVRRCVSCHVAGSCPAYQAEAECAFDIPLEVKTKEQLLGLLQGVIEMQSQRIVFARYAEELEGGYPDPNLSNEIDRLFRVIQQAKEIQDDRDFLNITVQAHAGAGVLSRIFGQKEAEPTHQLRRQLDPVQTDHVLAQVVEAEIVNESSNSNGHYPGGNGT